MLQDRIEELRLINASGVGACLRFLASLGDYLAALGAFLKDLDGKLQTHEYISFLFGLMNGQYRIYASLFLLRQLRIMDGLLKNTTRRFGVGTTVVRRSGKYVS